MFNPLFIKTPEGNFVNLALVHTIKKLIMKINFLLSFLLQEKKILVE